MSDLPSSAPLERVTGVLWGLVLLTLPVTTFPYFPSIFSKTLVKPLALFPLVPLLLILLGAAWRARRFAWPPHTTPLAAFLLFALAATLLGALYAPLELRGQLYWERALRAWLSLGVGLSFFLAAAWMNRSQADLHRSLRWLYAGLALSFLWGGLQILAIYTPLLDTGQLSAIQELFSSRPLPPRRIAGFAYEPSWLADQVVLLYLPWLLASLLSGYRLTRFKWLDPALFLFAAVLLLFTFSRSGLINAAVVFLLVLLLTGRGWLTRLARWFLAPFTGDGYASPRAKWTARGLRLSGIFVALAALGLTLSLLAAQPYFARLWSLDVEGGFFAYVINISAGPRLAYTFAGLETYADHFLTGVGLGGSGFYLLDRLPHWSLTTVPEIARLLSPGSALFPNIKNLYVRLLAETGLVGFWFFLAFFISLLASIRTLLKSGSSRWVYVGVAGLFLWLALAVRNFTQDSLAFPPMWVGLGIVLGLAASRRGKESAPNG